MVPASALVPAGVRPTEVLLVYVLLVGMAAYVYVRAQAGGSERPLAWAVATFLGNVLLVTFLTTSA